MRKIEKIILGIVVLAVILRIFLLFISPFTMFADGIIRYLPNAEQVVRGDFSFNDVPFFIMIEAFWMLIFSGPMLWFAWKLTAFISFIAILFLLPKLFKRFQLNNVERVIAMALFFFSTWSLLLSATVMIDMLMAFFTISLFLVLEKYFEKPTTKLIFISILLTILLTLTKATGFIIMAGFGLYILFKKISLKNKTLAFLSIVIGVLPSIAWFIKNYILRGNLFIWAVSESPNPAIYPLKEYVPAFINFYHYLWEIPLPFKVNLQGIWSSFFKVYYVAAIIVTAVISLLMIIAFIKYGRKKKEYALLMFPLLLFSLIYEPFIVWFGISPNAGRYIFPFMIFLFIFTAKYISSMKKNLKRICCIILGLFCILSIISAFGISLHTNNTDNQILEMKQILEKENLENSIIISNDEFTAASLNFYLRDYLKNPIHFNMDRNVIDSNVKCEGNIIFESKNFKIFKENLEYKICRTK